MKKILNLTVLAAMALALNATAALANGGPVPLDLLNGHFGGPVGVETPNSNTGEVELYNAVNSLLGTSYTSDAQIDSLEYTGNTSVWTQTGNSGYAVIGLGAAATNRLDVYNTVTPTTLIDPLGVGFTGNHLIGNGTSGSPYLGTGGVFAPGTTFGFDLNEKLGSTTNNWRSDWTMNSDGMDHMIVYYLPSLTGKQVYVLNTKTNTESLVTLNNPYLLGFEDSPMTNPITGAPSDQDFNDLMFLVDGVAPVPEPMTLALFAFGLLVLAGFAMRRKFKFARF